jgi:hypothetical protein
VTDDALQELLDERAIIARLDLFAYLLDHREWLRVGEVLAPDAFAYGESGVDDIVNRSLRRHLGGCGPTQHLLGNYRVQVTGDAATSVTYARVMHQGKGARAHLTWECLGEYRDAWRRTSAGWRMVRRDFQVRVALGDMDVLQPG